MEFKRKADIEAFLERPGGVRAALLHGPDQGLVRARGERLARAATESPADPFNVALLAEADLASRSSRLEEELAAYSLVGGRRLVRLRLGGDRGLGEDIALDGLRRHLAGELNPACLLIIEAGVQRKGSALRTVTEKSSTAAAIACYPDVATDVARLTRERLAEDRVGLSAEALQRFAGSLPGEHGIVLAEIERLALFLGPGSGLVGGDSDLAAFLGVEPEASVAQAAYHAFGARSGAAFSELRRAEREGEGGPPAVRAIALHLARLRRAAEARRGGRPLSEVLQSIGIFWKSREEFTRQAQVWSLGELDAVQAQTFAAEEACRRTGAPAALIAERLMFSVVARGRRLGL